MIGNDEKLMMNAVLWIIILALILYVVGYILEKYRLVLIGIYAFLSVIIVIGFSVKISQVHLISHIRKSRRKRKYKS